MYKFVYARRVIRPTDRRRNRLPVVLLVAVCLVAGTAAVSGASTGGPGLRFAGVGRWFADPSKDRVFHVNGMSRSVDAQVTLDDVEPGTDVVEGERSSYVIGSDSIRGLDKLSLRVTGTTAAPAEERPVTVDTAGGPYAVYRQAGKVMRLGSPATVIDVPGPLGRPVMTPDSTLWLHRSAAGLLCQLAPDAGRPTCAVTVPTGHAGALTVLGDSAVFLDFTDDTMTVLTLDGPGAVTAIGADLPAGALVAPGSVLGRIAVVAGDKLLLLDAHGVAGQVTLPPGRWAAPVAGRSSIVLLDLTHRRIRTYDVDGAPRKVTPLPSSAGEPLLRQGQDARVYVQSGDGRHVLVVGDEGGAEAVTTGSPVAAPSGSTPADPTPPVRTPPPSALPTSAPPTSGPPTSEPVTQSPPIPGPTVPSTRPSTDRQPPGPTPVGPGPTRTTRPGVPPPPTERPGVPPGLSAVARSSDLILTWGAARPNGADISTYEVTWAATTGDRGSTVVAGDARSATIGKLPRAVAYQIGVAARNANGLGEAARLEASLPTRWITVSRGADTTWENVCGPPECAYIQVELFGFPPNTKIQIEPVASEWGHFNDGAALTTDANGFLGSHRRFPFSGVGQTVWVDIDGTESNRFRWPERGP
jgi:fibronectin type III domain protein